MQSGSLTRWLLSAVSAAVLLAAVVLLADTGEVAAANVGGLYTNRIAQCLAQGGNPPKTLADRNYPGPGDGVTTASELDSCVRDPNAVNPKFGVAPASQNPQASVGAATRIQDPGKQFHALFVGTDGTGANTGAESDPCTLEAAVKQWPTWSDPNQDRVRVLDAALKPDQCPSNGQATEDNVITELTALKTKVQANEEFVFFFAGHGQCVAGGGLEMDKPTIANPDGVITGAELATFLSGFQKGVTLTVIIDACFSGNILNALVGPCPTKPCATTPPIAIKDINDQPLAAANLSVLTCADKVTPCDGLRKPPVGGISLDPGAEALPLQSQPSSGSDAWLLAEALAGTAATAVALGGAAWYARRRRVQ